MKTILWWGRFDPDYARNRIIRAMQQDLGYQIIDFHPRLSVTAAFEASVKGVKKPDLIWVPCFRQRDVLAAAKWAKSHKIPMIFDPLISAWDKQVFERKKLAPDSQQANTLLKNETIKFQQADILIADTEEHARFFQDTFDIDPHQIIVVPVGAEELLFKPAELPAKRTDIIEVLFYGSFINLQGPQLIIEAARLCKDQSIHWHFLGRGPLLSQCQQLAEGYDNIIFEDWMDYQQLPARIQKAHILLGVFGTTDKAGRVIPNKLYQSIACGRPVITRASTAYPAELQTGIESGIFQVPTNDPQALCNEVIKLNLNRELLVEAGMNARKSYEQFFSNDIIKNKLEAALLIAESAY